MCLRFVAISFLCFSFNCFTANAETENKLDTVILNLGWKHQFQFAGFYAAKELGFFEEQGIHVEFFDGKKYGYYPFPAKNEFEYFIAPASWVLSSENRDDYLIASTMFQQSSVALLVRSSDNINTLKELEGKKLAYAMEVQAMLKIAGADLNTIQFSDAVTDTSLLLNKEYDGILLFINDIYLEDIGEEFKIFRPLEYGINFYGDCLLTTQRELKQNPERVKKMREAMLKGWNYIVTHPEEAIQMSHKYNPSIGIAALRGESEIVINSLVMPKLYEFGTSDEVRWDNMINVLTDLELIETPPNLDKLIYNPEKHERDVVLYYFKILLVVLGVIGIILFILVYLNIQLKKVIGNKTEALEGANQELEALNFFRVKLFAIVSHDVSKPINNLKGIIQLFNEGVTTQEEVKKLMLVLETQLEEVNFFLNNILKWSKQNFDKKAELVDLQKIQIAPLLERILILFSFEIEKKKISIQNEVNGVSVFADENMMNTILRNLISNAVKFSKDSGDIKIYSSATEYTVTLIVEDNGIGMSQKQLDNIFTENITSTKGAKQEVGTGLGLMICKQYVEQNNGHIGVDSKEGEGSTFWVELPK